MREPVMPYGWPIAIEPPFGLICSSVMPSWRMAVEQLRREGLVELDDVDVRHLQAGALEQLRHREDRADAHLFGTAAGDREAAVDAERLDAEFLGALRRHQDRRRRAVAELARVAGGDGAGRA